MQDSSPHQHSIPERVRAQLLALGIPASEHDVDTLAGLFPQEFNVGATTLDAEDMARVLLYLVEKKIISAPSAASPASIRKVEPGWHSCQFYRDFDQLLDMVAPYVAEGLENGEACLWVMPAAVTREAACAALARDFTLISDMRASAAYRLAAAQNLLRKALIETNGQRETGVLQAEALAYG